jgi:outer membrane protein OmpA-like peptidoglycan-associated protein
VQIIALSILLSFFNCYPQISQTVNHAFHNAFVFGLDGGVTLPQTDYQKIKMGYSLRAVGEYFIKTNSSHLFGFKFKLGSEEIGSEDSRLTILTDDGPREIPPSFKTSIFSAGLAITYSISIGDVFFPYLSVGFSNLWIDPKNDQNKPALGNAAGLYNKSVKAYSFEIGFRFLVNDRLSLNLSANPYIPLTDYLDDVAAANKNDSYTSILIGFSYSPTFNDDPDGDGITGTNDLCPEEPEDFDGYQDEDGCPDVDNDGDGIPDINDKCPNEPEDFNGYQDDDGCPDGNIDSDGDGIPDYKDKCPNEAEDFNGYQDDDGCPDGNTDSDGDGIPDYKDKCPDQPETFNGLEDEDGCPDSTSHEEETFNQFILRGDDTFESNSTTLTALAKFMLDEIASYIKSQPESKWKIEGYTDNQGSASILKKLSIERANAVYNYLISRGLSENQFTVSGLGGSAPITTNNTDEGRSANRRILIIRAD